jgi:hypothetical protein
VLKFKTRLLSQQVGFEVRQLFRLWQLCIVSLCLVQAFGLCLSKAIMTTASRGVPGDGVDGRLQSQVHLAAWSEPVCLAVGCLQACSVELIS